MTRIAITCPSCGEILVAANDVVLTRHLPDGDGALTYRCGHCSTLRSAPVNVGDVMTAVFAGVQPIDVESIEARRSTTPQRTDATRQPHEKDER